MPCNVVSSIARAWQRRWELLVLTVIFAFAPAYSCVNRNVNVNVNNNYYHGGGYYGGGCCYHPVAVAAAVTATAVVTAAVVGSIVHSVPPSCSSVIVNGLAYQQCGSTWYQPQFSGTTTTYIVVNAPR
jgi:hypothetical protein